MVTVLSVHSLHCLMNHTRHLHLRVTLVFALHLMQWFVNKKWWPWNSCLFIQCCDEHCGSYVWAHGQKSTIKTATLPMATVSTYHSNDTLSMIYSIYSWPSTVHNGIARPEQGRLRKLSNHSLANISLLIEGLWQWMLPLLFTFWRYANY